MFFIFGAVIGGVVGYFLFAGDILWTVIFAVILGLCCVGIGSQQKSENDHKKQVEKLLTDIKNKDTNSEEKEENNKEQ